MRVQYLASFLCFFFLIGCGGNNVSIGSEEFPPTMTGNVVIEGKTYEMAQGGFSWERKVGSETEVVMTDAASPNQIAAKLDGIAVQPNSKITIEIEEDPEITAFLWNEQDQEGTIELEDYQFDAPTESGRYIYEVVANWSNGEVSYTFVIEVK